MSEWTNYFFEKNNSVDERKKRQRFKVRNESLNGPRVGFKNLILSLHLNLFDIKF
jgi:hypothetical protein